jgi:hypothetical protein
MALGNTPNRPSPSLSSAASRAKCASTVSYGSLKSEETEFTLWDSDRASRKMQDDDQLSRPPSEAPAWSDSQLGRSDLSLTSTTPTEELGDNGRSSASFEVYDVPHVAYVPEALPSTPRDFQHLFQSAKSISIRHDDSTFDGNMNLRLDTMMDRRDGTRLPVTLFYFRMHDLKSRNFSIRRYSRDSGREVCHSIEKPELPASTTKAMLSKSLTSAWATITRQHSVSSRSSKSSRGDDWFSDEDLDEDRDLSDAPKTSNPGDLIPIEFSNYAHVEIKRRGRDSKRRYTFEYWGSKYYWKRQIITSGSITETMLHLYREGDDVPLAHIMPYVLTAPQRHEESMKGGWVPPSSLWINDKSLIASEADLAE